MSARIESGLQLPMHWPLWAQYLLALSLVALALLTRGWLHDRLGDRLPFMPMAAVLLPLVVLVRPGVFVGAAVVGWTSAWVLFWPAGARLGVFGGAEGLLNALYGVLILGAGLAAWLSSRDQQRRGATEEALRESEERLRLATSAGRVGVWDWDIERNRVTWSDALYAIHGLAPGTFDGTVEAFAALVHPSDRAFVDESLRRAIIENARYELEFRAVRPDGGIVWIYTHATILRDASGRATRMLGGTVDITRRKYSEEALRDSEARFRSIFRTSMVGIVLSDAEGVWLDVNPSMCELLGFSREELVGRAHPELVPPAYCETGVQAVAALAEHGNWRGELALRTADGREIIFDWHATRLPESGLRLAVASDVTERTRVEAALRESEEKFRTLADNIAQFAWMADETGWLFWYNRRWFEYTGTTLAEMQGWGWRNVHHPEHVERVTEKFRKHIEAGELWEDTFPLRGRDGRYRWFLSRAVPIRDDAGRITRWFGTNTDVTEQRRHQEQMRLVMAELNHRVKNTLATIDAIAQQTMHHAAGPQEFCQAFTTRLRSMAAAHSLLTRSDWSGAELRDILSAELKPRVTAPSHLLLDGPAVVIRPRAALALHMAIHELATNAAKYGALSEPAGSVRVSWRVTGPPGEGARLAIDWKEQDGPPVVEPRTRSFGSQMITEVVEYELEGVIERRFEPDGMWCRIELPLERIAGTGAAGQLTPPSQPVSSAQPCSSGALAEIAFQPARPGQTAGPDGAWRTAH